MAKRDQLKAKVKSTGKPVTLTTKTGAKKHFSSSSEDWARKGCKEGEKRFMMIANEQQIEQLSNIAYWERLTKKEALAEALSDYIEKHKSEANKQRPEGK